MQFLTSKTTLYIRTIALFVASFLLATNPKRLLEANFVHLLGEAMKLPRLEVNDNNELLGLLCILAFFLGFTDLIPLMADNVQHFEAIVPARLMVYFILTGYCYMMEGSFLSNNVMFVYSFTEVWINFLTFNNLRDEKVARLKEYVEQHGEELKQEEDQQVRVVRDD